MTYGVVGPWHQEADGAWTHDAIPGITISRDADRAKPGRPAWVITDTDGRQARAWSFVDAKRLCEAIALAGAEGKAS